MNRLEHSILLAIILAVMTGCSIKHTPALDIPAAPYIPPNYGVQMEPVTIENHTDNNIALTGKVLSLTFQATPSEYGDAIIALLERELKKNGIRVTKESNRAIGVAVTDVDLVYPKRYRCDLNLALVLGDETVGIEGTSTLEGYDVKKIIDSAIADAVRKILHDERFVSYITKPPQLGN